MEKLTQVKGKCDMIVYKDSKGEIITLNEGDTLTIEPAGTYHIHNNPYDEASLTYWDFDGDITHLIEQLRSSDKEGMKTGSERLPIGSQPSYAEATEGQARYQTVAWQAKWFGFTLTIYDPPASHSESRRTRASCV
ncbi:hypothetical protein IH980_01120 [Patescibacteria group bacterium]|nr:hypothetical protein [Patescibacteria group bacterium]